LSKTPNRRRWVLVAVSVLVVMGLLGWAVARGVHQGRLHALFSGPLEQEQETRSGFYPGMTYDLTGYLPDDVPVEPDGEEAHSILDEKDEVRKRGPDATHMDSTSVAAQLKWLKSPTVYRARWVPRFLTVTYPPPDAVFPPNLCSPFIEWNDVHNDLWQVTVLVPHAKLEWRFLTHGRRWRIPDDVWEQVKTHAVNGPARLWVKGVKRSGLWGKARESVHASQMVDFRISTDPADNAIVYQMIDPPFTHEKAPSIYVRDLRRKEGRFFLNTRQKYCTNCHTWSSKTGTRGKVGLQVRYRGVETPEYRSYLIVYDIETRESRKIILPLDLKLSTFTSWSPDGTRLAISARQSFPVTTGPRPLETQNLGQDSDIAIYDAASGTGGLLKGACDPKDIEVYPRWTPDSASLVFSWAPGGRDVGEIQYDLRIIPYNDGRGGTATPVPGASRNGKSNYHHRFSPDGKWFSFVRSNWASLIKPSSDIYIMPADFRSEPRPLECNAPYAADSWHSWSTNGRWIVFASKRDDGIFARLYMTHIDDEGKASPAVRLPVEDVRVRMSFNVPEFLANVPRIEERRLFQAIGIDTKLLQVKPWTVEANEPGPS